MISYRNNISSHISRIALSEIDNEMKLMEALLNIGKKGRIIALDNALIFEIVTGANYNLIEYAIKTNSSIGIKHIKIILSMLKM